MNAKERKALQRYVKGEDFESNSLRNHVSRLLAKEENIQERFKEVEKENIKVMAEAERLKGLLLQQLGEISDLINEKKWVHIDYKANSERIWR